MDATEGPKTWTSFPEPLTRVTNIRAEAATCRAFLPLKKTWAKKQKGG